MADEQGPETQGPPAKGDTSQTVVPDPADQQEQDEAQKNKEAQAAYLAAQGTAPELAGQQPEGQDSTAAGGPPEKPKPEGEKPELGSLTQNPNEDVIMRGLSDAALHAGENIYGVARNLGEAAGLWRGAHGKYTTQADVEGSPAVQKLEAQQLKMYGAPQSEVEKLATGLVSLAAGTAVAGAGGAIKTAATLSAVSRPGDIAQSMSNLPFVGGAARTVFQTLHLEKGPDDAYAVAQLKDVGSWVLTDLAFKPIAAALGFAAEKMGLVVPKPAVDRKPPVTATVSQGPDGNFQMALDRQAEGRKFVPPATEESNFKAGKARQAAGKMFSSPEIVPTSVFPLPGMSQGDAEAMGASIEHASIAHDAADVAESGGKLLDNEQRAGVKTLAIDLAETGGQSATGIITNFRLHDALPYLADPEHMGGLLDEMTDALKGHTMEEPAIENAIRDIHPAADENVINRVKQAVQGSENGRAVLGAMQAATRLQGHVVQGLAQAADASPGNVIGQANLASAAHFAMEVGHRIQDLFEKGDMSWTKRASGARGFSAPGVPNLTPTQEAGAKVSASMETEGVENTPMPTGPATQTEMQLGVKTTTQLSVEDYQRKVLGLGPSDPIEPEHWESLVTQFKLSDGNPETVWKAIQDAQDQTAARRIMRTTPQETVPFGLTYKYARAVLQTVNLTAIGNIVSRVGTISKIFLSGLANIMTEASSKALGALPTNPISAVTWAANMGRTGPLLRGYNAQLMRESYQSIFFGVKHLGDAFQLAKASLIDGGSVLAPQSGGVINAPVPQGLGWLHSLAHVTSSIHIATSEINRTIDYLGNVEAEATSKRMAEGLTGSELARKVDMDVKFSQTPEGYGINPDARNAALRNTNTRPLTFGSLAQVMQNNANSSVVARQMFKIIRMPVNELTYIGEMTPFLGQFVRQTKADLAEGGQKALVAQGRMEFGSAAIASIIPLTHAGVITGGGPTDPKAFKDWAQNNVPYSIGWPGSTKLRFSPYGAVAQVGKMASTAAASGEEFLHAAQKQQRIEALNPHYSPHAFLLGRVADLIGASAHIPEQDYEKMMSHLLSGMGYAAQNEIFFKDAIKDTGSLLAGDMASLKHWGREVVADLAVPGFVSSFNFDPVKREIDTVWGAIASKVPGLSQTLPPYRDGAGRPMMAHPGYAPTDAGSAEANLNPFSLSHQPHDEIEDQLMSMGKSLVIPHPVQFNNLDNFRVDFRSHEFEGPDQPNKGQTPWDRLGELVNTEQVRGNKPLAEALRDKMESESWKRLASTDNIIDPHTKANKEIQDIVSQYYHAATRQLMREYPKLHVALKGDRSIARAAKGGNEAAEDRAITDFMEHTGKWEP